MQISITARHCEVSTGLRQFVTQRLEKFEKFAHDIHGIHVIVSQERARCAAEITVRLNGHQLVCTETHAEPGAAIELAADRIEEKLRRHKDRRIARHHRPGVDKGASSATGEPGEAEDIAEE